MRNLWCVNRDSIARTHHSASDNPRHDPGTIVRSWSRAQNGPQKSGLKPIDQHTRRSETAQFYDRFGAEMKPRAKWQTAQVYATGCDVLSQHPWADCVPVIGKLCKKL